MHSLIYFLQLKTDHKAVCGCGCHKEAISYPTKYKHVNYFTSVTGTGHPNLSIY